MSHDVIFHTSDHFLVCRLWHIPIFLNALRCTLVLLLFPCAFHISWPRLSIMFVYWVRKETVEAESIVTIYVQLLSSLVRFLFVFTQLYCYVEYKHEA